MFINLSLWAYTSFKIVSRLMRLNVETRTSMLSSDSGLPRIRVMLVFIAVTYDVDKFIVSYLISATDDFCFMVERCLYAYYPVSHREPMISAHSSLNAATDSVSHMVAPHIVCKCVNTTPLCIASSLIKNKLFWFIIIIFF